MTEQELIAYAEQIAARAEVGEAFALLEAARAGAAEALAEVTAWEQGDDGVWREVVA